MKIRGERHYLWRAVDQDGDLIDILVQRYHNARAWAGDESSRRHSDRSSRTQSRSAFPSFQVSRSGRDPDSVAQVIVRADLLHPEDAAPPVD